MSSFIWLMKVTWKHSDAASNVIFLGANDRPSVLIIAAN